MTYRESRNAQGVALVNSEMEGYLVKYGTNTKPGNGSVTIYGMGKYGGSKTVEFTIYPKWIFG